MNVRNYQKELEQIIAETAAGEDPAEVSHTVPTLLLHACCAPCSSYVMEYLKTHFAITLYYYNPNITDAEEYGKRMEEARRLVRAYNETLPGPDIVFLEGSYEPGRYLEAVKGLEDEPEGGRRCEVCFRLRLAETLARAREQGSDRFCTTLSISPLKNAPLLNAIGEELAGQDGGPRWLPSDFKKRGGYQRSIELSAEYGLYRQNYCGCVFSRRKRKEEKK